VTNGNELVSLAVFENHNIRQIWHDDRWFFSVVDVVRVLTESKNPQQYWYTLKGRLAQEGANGPLTICKGLKLPAADGKMRETDCADTETMLRIIQSIPSPKAEPFKQWLAQVGTERLEEIEDPEKALDEWRERAIRSYMARGYSEGWARNRVDAIIARKSVTGQWAVRGIKPREYAILTDRMHMGTFGLGIQEHMELKGFPVIRRGNRLVHKGDLREGMTALESAVITFAENVSTGLHIQRDSQGFAEVARDVDDAAELAKENRIKLEQLTGQPVVSKTNMTIERDGGLWGLLPPPDEA